MKSVILTFAAFYLPGYKAGGPIRTIANLVEALGDEFDFRIVTSDRDATDSEPYPRIAPNDGWMKLGKAKVLYLSPTERSLGRISKILRETPHDVLYLNSFFDPDFTLKPLMARRFGLAPAKPAVLAPRGEFSPNALKLKAWKKMPFLVAARLAGLYRGLTWQASSVHEKANIEQSLRNTATDIRIAPDLPSMNEGGAHCPRAIGDPLRICFLSRISPMKNLEFALQTLKHVRAHTIFDIYGPVGDEDYWSRCQVLMAQLPENITVTYHGNVEYTDVPSTLARYDLFFLPTKGENYGHVIFEALAAGTPVLISDQTPWRNLDDANVGWNLSLVSMPEFVSKIEALASMGTAEYLEKRLRCEAFALAELRKDGAVSKNQLLFGNAVSEKSK
ncbi:MAG: glycosyltransferase [Parvibaculum sp.]|nr:glycosyltransferase [Parvibaculum sp.]